MTRAMSPEKRRERAHELDREAAELERRAKRLRRHARRLQNELCPPDCSLRSSPRWSGKRPGDPCQLGISHWPGDAWRRLGLEPPETFAEHLAYASWVAAHASGVLEVWKDEPAGLLNAVSGAMKYTDCEFPCEDHRQVVTPEQAEALAPRLGADQ